MVDADAEESPEEEPTEEEGTDAENGAAELDEGNAEAGPEDEDLVGRVADHDEALAEAVEELARRVEAAEAELDERRSDVEELEERLKRERADFQNYKRRAKQREEELKERATEDLVERLLDVRDNIVRALDQDDDADIRDGVEATLATFDRILEDENVAAIEPEPGEEVDPEVHEAVMRVEDGEQPEGTIENVYRPGYELAGKVLQPAQVTVSDGPAEE